MKCMTTAGVEPELVSLSKLAKRTGIEKESLRKFTREGGLPAYQLGLKVYVNLEEYRAWLASHKVSPND